MSGIVFAIGLVAVLTILSVRAAGRYKTVDRLPMQWSISGKVIWSAPKGIALSFTPVLAAVVVGGTAIAIAILPEPGAGAISKMGVLVIMALCFAAAHAFHLWLIGRTIHQC